MRKIKPGVTLYFGNQKYNGEIPKKRVLKEHEKFLLNEQIIPPLVKTPKEIDKIKEVDKPELKK